MARKLMLKDTPGFDKSLVDLYENQRMTIREIAKIIGCSDGSICLHLKRCGINARLARDYEPTQKMRDAGRIIGMASRGRFVSDNTRQKISKAKTGARKRSDYEFGGHEKKRSDGYIKVYSPDHPNSTKDGYVMKHILVMERELERYLQRDEVIHHINHNREDNRIENLKLMTFKEHARLHMTERHAVRREIV